LKDWNVVLKKRHFHGTVWCQLHWNDHDFTLWIVRKSTTFMQLNKLVKWSSIHPNCYSGNHSFGKISEEIRKLRAASFLRSDGDSERVPEPAAARALGCFSFGVYLLGQETLEDW